MTPLNNNLENFPTEMYLFGSDNSNWELIQKNNFDANHEIKDIIVRTNKKYKNIRFVFTKMKTGFTRLKIHSIEMYGNISDTNFSNETEITKEVNILPYINNKDVHISDENMDTTRTISYLLFNDIKWESRNVWSKSYTNKQYTGTDKIISRKTGNQTREYNGRRIIFKTSNKFKITKIKINSKNTNNAPKKISLLGYKTPTDTIENIIANVDNSNYQKNWQEIFRIDNIYYNDNTNSSKSSKQTTIYIPQYSQTGCGKLIIIYTIIRIFNTTV